MQIFKKIWLSQGRGFWSASPASLSWLSSFNQNIAGEDFEKRQYVSIFTLWREFYPLKEIRTSKNVV